MIDDTEHIARRIREAAEGVTAPDRLHARRRRADRAPRARAGAAGCSGWAAAWPPRRLP